MTDERQKQLEKLRQKKEQLQRGEKVTMRGTVRNLGLGSPEAAQNMILLAIEEQGYLLQEVLAPMKASLDRAAIAIEQLNEQLSSYLSYTMKKG